jgi:hypothetical protein
MQIFQDYGGHQVLLADFAEQHIIDGHYEIAELGLYEVVGEILASPDIVVSYNRALHFFRMYSGTEFGDKYVRVVVTENDEARHVRTAFITSRVVKGSLIWKRET